jgi:tight adherence protein B
MWLLPVTFAAVFTLVCAVYWLLVVRPERSSRSAVSRRLRVPKPAAVTAGGPIVKAETRMSSIPMLDSALTRAGVASGRLQQLLDSADVSTSVGRFVLASLLLGLAVYAFVSLVLKQQGSGLVLGLVAASIPTFYVRRLRTVRFRKFEEQFPEAIDLIARAMRAGHGLSAGLGMVADEIPQPVGREFRLLYDWQNFGMTLNEALHRFAERVPTLDARFFVTAVLTQRESGGNLSEVLDNLSRVIRERFRIRRQIRVLSAHGRITGAVLCSLPPALAFYFFVTRPDYIQELSGDPMGVRLVIAAILLQITGMLIIRRLVNIEY